MFQTSFALTHPKQAAGFTLIELSIVLVIIGLIVGGVLVGNDLIKAAQLRSLISHQEGIQAAVATFRVKYNCLPGDCKKASKAGLTSPSGSVSIDGNGDKIIGRQDGYMFLANGANTTSSTLGNELMMFWEHLSQASLIDSYSFPSSQSAAYHSTAWPTALQPYGYGLPADGPRSGNSWWAGYGDGSGLTGWTRPAGYRPINSNALFLFGPNTRCAKASCGGTKQAEGLLTEEANAIDTKADDGLPWSGNIRAVGGGNYFDGVPLHPRAGAFSAPNLCVAGNDMDSTYASFDSNNITNCNLSFKLMAR